MAAPGGNEFWKLRSKHGRDKIFKTPDLLWEACQEYFEVTSKRVWNKIDFRGKDADRVEIPTSVPFTITGLCIFLGLDHSTWLRYKSDSSQIQTSYDKDFMELDEVVFKDFHGVITRVESIVYTQKFEGATVNGFNANIIARDLGLVDKKELSGDAIKPVVFNVLTPNDKK
jgi:DNA-packaging protein gp3